MLLPPSLSNSRFNSLLPTRYRHVPSSTISSNSFRAPAIYYGVPASSLSDRTSLDNLWEGQKEGFIGVFIAVKDGSDTAIDQIDKHVLFPPLFPFRHD